MSSRTPRRRTPGRAATWLTLAGLGLVVGGAALWWSQPTAPEVGSTGTSSGGTPGAQQVRSALPMATRVEAAPGQPERLVVPALELDAPVVAVAAPGGVLTPPSDPSVLGWWADGARPGSGRGSALVTGHTVHGGGGAMDDLERLEPGDRVWVRTDTSRIGYRVREVEVLGKGVLARRAERVFDQAVPGRLVLITCEDWDGEDYLSNVVVTATPVA